MRGLIKFCLFSCAFSRQCHEPVTDAEFDSQDCSSPRNDVLILNTREPVNIPLVTNAAGDVDRDIYFSIDNDAEVYESCSLVWQNELYVYGGYSKKRQISKVNACVLEKIGELTFNHNKGDCINVADERIYICFNDKLQ